jgi:hypothetical protein
MEKNFNKPLKTYFVTGLFLAHFQISKSQYQKNKFFSSIKKSHIVLVKISPFIQVLFMIQKYMKSRETALKEIIPIQLLLSLRNISQAWFKLIYGKSIKS